VAGKISTALAAAGMDTLAISTSFSTVSGVVTGDRLADAVKALNYFFDLSQRRQIICRFAVAGLFRCVPRGKLSPIDFWESLHDPRVELLARLFSDLSQYGLGIPGRTVRTRKGHGVENVGNGDDPSP